MEAALALIPARTEFLSVESAGHELMTRTNREELVSQVTTRFLAFVS